MCSPSQRVAAGVLSALVSRVALDPRTVILLSPSDLPLAAFAGWGTGVESRAGRFVSCVQLLISLCRRADRKQLAGRHGSI